MPQSKNYFRRCENCCYETNVSSGWCRHIKTAKHIKLNKILQNENDILVDDKRTIQKIQAEIVRLKFTRVMSKIREIRENQRRTEPPPPPQLKQVCIYCICVGDNNYVGHSFNIENRKSNHKQSCNHDNRLLYKTIREIGGWDNVKFTELARYEECDLTKAVKMETKHFYEIKPNLNMCIPTNTYLINPFIKSS